MTPSPVSLSELESVAELLPAFEFEYLIAHGDSGSVYKARQRSLDRDVAIKITTRGTGVDHSCQAGAKAMAGLNHPNIIRVYDSGEAGGFFYLVMEFVPGSSLEHSARGRAIDPHQASEIIIAACQGLAHAHASGVVHGGITPSDILLNPKCEPKIGNWGASLCKDDNTALQSDVFALGLILRELLTGVSLNSSQAAHAVIPDLKLAMICRKATHPDPAQRYADTTSFGEALSRALIPVKPTPPAQKPQVSPLHRPKPALAVSRGYAGHALVRSCAVIAFLLVSIYGTWSFHHAKQERLTHVQKDQDAKPKAVIVEAEPDRAISTALVSWNH